MTDDQEQTRLAVAKTYKLYIGGQFPRTESGRYERFSADAVNVCRASRKDLRNAVVAARKAVAGWSAASAYLRGQIIYRIAEMLEGRSTQFAEELEREGLSRDAARANVREAIDRLVYYAGWSDKFTQVCSSVNPVASSHFNFSVPEPMGVVGIAAPESGLFGLVSALAPVIVGGNVAVLVASVKHPLTAISFAEVLHASDVPAGVVNVLTGRLEELLPVAAEHMDINALALAAGSDVLRATAAEQSAGNLKRVVNLDPRRLADADGAGPHHIQAFQEIKTTWHPVAQ
ncbi:MAG: aldehyde dehydrogenase family protein [Pseudomonadota bacterium]